SRPQARRLWAGRDPSLLDHQSDRPSARGSYTSPSRRLSAPPGVGNGRRSPVIDRRERDRPHSRRRHPPAIEGNLAESKIAPWSIRAASDLKRLVPPERCSVKIFCLVYIIRTRRGFSNSKATIAEPRRPSSFRGSASVPDSLEIVRWRVPI